MDSDLKTIKSLLLLGASAFCFALTGAGVATYAFFDISEGAKVSHLEFGVDGGGSLLLGLKENLSGDITYYQDVDDETLSRHYPSYSPGASLSPGCRSGWYCFASFLYAFLISSSLALLSSPRTS